MPVPGQGGRQRVPQSTKFLTCHSSLAFVPDAVGPIEWLDRRSDGAQAVGQKWNDPLLLFLVELLGICVHGLLDYLAGNLLGCFASDLFSASPLVVLSNVAGHDS